MTRFIPRAYNVRGDIMLFEAAAAYLIAAGIYLLLSKFFYYITKISGDAYGQSGKAGRPRDSGTFRQR